MKRFEPYGRSMLRIVAGLLFSCHGFQKVFGAFGGLGGKGATAAFGSLPWIGGMLEWIGGMLILIGLFTRPIAFVLCGEMAVAYFRSHAPRGIVPILNGGELAALYCFIYLYLFAAGPGPLSVDRLVRRIKG